MGLTGNQIYICNWIGFVFGVISLVCSLLTILIIMKMDKKNGYLMLIAFTTFFQILYDVNYILGVIPSFVVCKTWHFLDMLGGLSVALWTNIVSFIILYVVLNIKSVDIFGNFKYFFIIAVIPPMVLAVLEVTVSGVVVKNDDDTFEMCRFGSSTLANVIENIYYWGRLASIIINFAVFFFISWRLRSMAIVGGRTASRSEVAESTENRKRPMSLAGMNDAQSMAIYTLVNRMKYYPLMQALCRSGAAWNEFDDYKYDSFASFIMASICSPSTGACYFIVFLIMQPKAQKTLYSLLCNRITRETDNTGTADMFTSQSVHELDEDELENIINITSDERSSYNARYFNSRYNVENPAAAPSSRNLQYASSMRAGYGANNTNRLSRMSESSVASTGNSQHSIHSIHSIDDRSNSYTINYNVTQRETTTSYLTSVDTITTTSNPTHDMHQTNM